MYVLRCTNCGYISYSACEMVHCKCGGKCEVISDKKKRIGEDRPLRAYGSDHRDIKQSRDSR